jgi:glycosyltransferase involved in cell wall biosynthesis
MKSVDDQSFKNMEYIVVNNGSTVNIDDVVEDFMKEATIPIMYIKRSSGAGPHTGKNSAFRRARGKYLSMLDSDDEFLPDAIKILVETWEKLPVENRHEYREVVAQCIDEHGNRVGEPFVEHINMHVTQLLKDNMFPEPEGVSYVIDSIAIWSKLSKLYKSFFINECIKVYYTDSPDSITNVEIKKITLQHCINMLWADKYTLNHWSQYDYSCKDRIKRVLHYCLFANILKMRHNYPDYDWVKEDIEGIRNKLLILMFWLPSILIAKYYTKTKM